MTSFNDSNEDKQYNEQDSHKKKSTIVRSNTGHKILRFIRLPGIVNFLFWIFLLGSLICVMNRNLGIGFFDKKEIVNSIAPESGFAYIASINHPEWSAHVKPSTAEVLENGKPLRFSNSIHRDIRDIGRGRYSFWHDHLYFSASDNSDPRKNGKIYTIRGPWLFIGNNTAVFIYLGTILLLIASRYLTFRQTKNK